MAVYHVLRDGSRPKDIKGHVVKRTDAEAVYNLIESINRERQMKKVKRGASEK